MGQRKKMGAQEEIIQWLKNGKCAVRKRFAKKNGTNGLTEHENDEEADGSVYHGTEA